MNVNHSYMKGFLTPMWTFFAVPLIPNILTNIRRGCHYILSIYKVCSSMLLLILCSQEVFSTTNAYVYCLLSYGDSVLLAMFSGQYKVALALFSLQETTKSTRAKTLVDKAYDDSIFS
jgi:hypothetical protein